MRRDRSCRRYVFQASQTIRRDPALFFVEEQRLSAVERLLSSLAMADRQAAIVCAAICARTVPLRAEWRYPLEGTLEGLLSCALRGEGERRAAAEARREADEYASCKEDAYFRRRGVLCYQPSDLANAAAFRAVACVCDISSRPAAAAEAAAHAAAGTASRVASDRHAMYSASWRRTWDEAFRVHHETLFERLSRVRWTTSAPTLEQICSAPAPIAVLWDRLSEGRGEQSIAELLCAFDRAARLGLSFGDPVQRAVAERIADEGWARSVLARAGERPALQLRYNPATIVSHTIG